MGKRKRKTAKKTKGLSLAITSSSTEQQHAPRKRGRPRKVVAVESKEDKEEEEEIQQITTVQEQPSKSNEDEAIEGEEVLRNSREVECSENDVENKEALSQHHQPLRRRARKRNKPTRSS